LAEVLKYTCETCGEVHEGLPDYGFDAPIYYYWVPDEEREQRCSLGPDLCVIDDEYFFVRAVLQVPIVGVEQAFGWGVWSSLSEHNFNRYLELWDSEDVSGEGSFFGWLSNRLPLYPDTLSLKLEVHPQGSGIRPLLVLQASDHRLAVDQREGLSWARAVEMVEKLLHPENGDAEG
jgi:hypothetical protein